MKDRVIYVRAAIPESRLKELNERAALAGLSLASFCGLMLMLGIDLTKRQDDDD
jgi:hypothetical protein